MTEEEWQTAIDPQAMLSFPGANQSERKLRLFAVACCGSLAESSRQGKRLAMPTRASEGIDLAERIAEGSEENPLTELDHYYGFYSVHHNSGDTLDWILHAILDPSALGAAAETVRMMSDVVWDTDAPNFGSLALRDIVGNPFRPVVAEPAWLTEAAVGIARGVYDERAFERLPILADALQEAGCEDADVLSHCREPGTHVRGCWVVDLVLGKS